MSMGYTLWSDMYGVHPLLKITRNVQHFFGIRVCPPPLHIVFTLALRIRTEILYTIIYRATSQVKLTTHICKCKYVFALIIDIFKRVCTWVYKGQRYVKRQRVNSEHMIYILHNNS